MVDHLKRDSLQQDFVQVPRRGAPIHNDNWCGFRVTEREAGVDAKWQEIHGCGLSKVEHRELQVGDTIVLKQAPLQIQVPTAASNP